MDWKTIVAFVAVVFICISWNDSDEVVPVSQPKQVAKLFVSGGTKIVYPKATEVTEPEFFVYKIKNNRIKEKSFFADIINHSNDPFMTHDRDTNAHETTHGINSDIRNNLGKPRDNAFYVGNDKAIIIREPNMKKSSAIPFIPMKLRSSRFQLYFITNQDWENEPLYIFDEWVAYLNGSTVSIEDAERGGTPARTDAVKANLEFSIYSVAIAMAVEKHDPNYWKTNTQFKTYLKWSLKRSHDLFMRGKKYFPWEDQDTLLNDLRTAPEAESMRRFIKSHCDGIWL